MGGAVLDGPSPDAPAPASSTGDKVRLVLRGIGQTLITFGLVVLLFVFYEVYVTNWFSDREQAKVQKQITETFKKGEDVTLPLPGGKVSTIPLGTGIANLYIPRLGKDYKWTIVEGTSQTQLEKGPGHYSRTALPGQVGNFAVAGHRVGKGEPFLNVDHLQPGDAVVVETESHWYVYDIKGTEHGLTQKDSDGIPGREIVDPSDSLPLYSVPDHPGKAPTERLMTMTTCTPKFSASQRMIVYAKWVASYSKATGTAPMPAAVQALYNGVS
jgi:sortase A